MPRRKRNMAEPCCYHIAHRCQEWRYLLKFGTDRRNYLRRMLQMKHRYPVDVLTYMATCNHIHLLLWAKRAADVSQALQFLQGSAAGDYNRRKGRQGAFWAGRYHPTLVETGSHLSRCLLYIDLNMVRAGRVGHPRDWWASGFRELSGNHRRNRIIDRPRLLNCLGVVDRDAFEPWYLATIEQEVARGYFAREPWWSRAVAVGSEEWVAGVAAGVHNAKILPARPVTDDGVPLAVHEEPAMYAVYAAKRARQEFWRDRQTKG